MLWTALLLVSASAAPASPTPAATASAAVDIAVIARTFHVDVGRASVSVHVDVDAVSRPTRVPVRVQAQPREHAGALASDPPLTLSVCDDQRCTLRSEITVPLDGTPVVVEASMFPSGIALSLRHLSQESQCCSMNTLGRNAPVVATTEPAGPHVDVQRDSSGGLVVVPVGETLQRRPSMIDAFDAIIVADEGWPIGGLPDSRDAELVRFVERGGIASVPATMLPNATKELTQPRVNPPEGTKLVAFGDGHYIVRPLGASREEQLAGLIAVRPDLLYWTPPYGQGDSVATRAAGAGLAARPHRGVAFLIGFACVAGAALCVRTARRRGWRVALTSSACVAVAGLAAVWLLERVSVPSETHVRVVAWLGPHASWEVGIDAIRPRSTSELTVAAPIMPVMATVLGAETPPREPQRSVGVDAKGDPEWRVTSTVGSAAALAVTWERAVPVRAQKPVTRVGDVVTNRLDVPLRAVTTNRGRAITRALAPHASRNLSEFDDVMLTDESVRDLSEMEQRLLHEISDACVSRLRPRTDPEQQMCGAAIAVLDDGTLLGIEVSP